MASSESQHAPRSLVPAATAPAVDGQLCLIGYARISDLSGKRGQPAARLGVEAQHAFIEEIARREGGLLVARYTDNDRSASRDVHRPGFEALLADLYRATTPEGRPVHGVIAVEDDRLYKTPEQWERFITAFRATPGRIYADEHGRRNLYSPDADEYGRSSVGIAMGENRRRQDRTRRWHLTQARRGIPHLGGRAFGYRPVAGAPGEIEIVPAEAEVIRSAVAACIAGRSWAAVTAIFQESGLATPGGAPWRIQTVKQILSSPRLAGLRMLGGEVVTKPDGEPVAGRWEPIISPDEWEAVRLRHPPRRRLPGGRSADPTPTSRRYLLSGFLRCGKQVADRTCNRVLAASATRTGASAYRYACRPNSDGGCGGTAVSGEWIDREIGTLVLDALALHPKAGRRTQPWTGEPEVQALRARRTALEAQWLEGRLEDAGFFRNLEALEAALRERQTLHAEWLAEQVVHLDGGEERWRRWWATPESGGYNLRQRRLLIERALISVLVFPAGKGRRRRGRDSYLPILKVPDGE